ncbi:MAG TPA: copper ion binding protein [Bacillota bacterium]|jgi:copper chaperone|nr:copper ion binding protein [Peptococcaceae bacterium MAG4]NLW38743.1 heavy-metal-associated domain-containing protein [Peptococcaceae bacterium]HPU35681.1 copper ion binding protein [Bacillota bacterium]HPZ43835.1 copper ion binding protein [Bacillota bacterium]HQD76576.1 copper ion binding protein [Bacillota bacterium]
MGEIKLTVEGMSCSHCQRAVEEALKGIPGVEKVQVDLEKKEVVVTGTAAPEKLAEAIEEAGYEVVG